MTRFANALRMHAASQAGTSPANRWGIVQSVDTVSMTAKVLIQPENVLSGFLPILSPSAGLICPPVFGQMVKLIPDSGDPDSYVIAGSSWNTGAMPPAGVAEGEIWHFAFGATIKMLTNGHVVISDASGTSLEFTNNGSAVLTGTLDVIGLIKNNGTIVVAP